MATTTTTMKSVIATRKSIASTTVSDSRQPSTPLSIAERFMSNNYDPDISFQDAIVTKKDISRRESVVNAAKDENVQTLIALDPPLFSSLEVLDRVHGLPTQHPLDDTPLKNPSTIKKVKCNAGCSKKHNSTQKTKRDIKKMHPYKHNKIDIAKTQVKVDLVPEEKSGIWIGSCCFLQWGKANKQQPLLPTRKHSNKSTDQCCCWGRRACVITTFLVVLMMAVLAFFFWPRIPLIRIEGAINTIPTKVTQTQQGGRTSNVAFESTWLLNITMDNRRNFFTTRFNRIQIIAKDAMTGLLVGKGLNNNLEAGIVVYLPGKEISTIQLPISVNYQARDTTDTTFSNIIRACTANSTIEISHHSLSIHFWFTLYIFGLDWLGYKPTLIAAPATGGFFCPSSSIMY